jgi:hypothetical protein
MCDVLLEEIDESEAEIEQLISQLIQEKSKQIDIEEYIRQNTETN